MVRRTHRHFSSLLADPDLEVFEILLRLGRLVLGIRGDGHGADGLLILRRINLRVATVSCNRHEKGAGQETLGCLGGEPRAGHLLALAKCLAFAVGHLGQELRARAVV